MVSLSGTYLPSHAGKLLRNVERLGQEALHLSGAADGQLVLLGQLVHAHDGDDILQLLIALQDALTHSRATR